MSILEPMRPDVPEPITGTIIGYERGRVTADVSIIVSFEYNNYYAQSFLHYVKSNHCAKVGGLPIIKIEALPKIEVQP